jgi:CheY-like chemotaxis protein
LESEVGVGSTFGFSIPVREAAGRPREDEPDPRDPVVVVIDDDRRSLDLMTVYLESWGVRAVQARDGTEGLETIRRVRPVAVVLDIRLPGIDGWEVLEQLRADAATQALPVVIASILDEKITRPGGRGPLRYLIKPVGNDDLSQAMRRIQCLRRQAGWSSDGCPEARGGDNPLNLKVDSGMC